jgi:hypothetical protein
LGVTIIVRIRTEQPHTGSSDAFDKAHRAAQVDRQAYQRETPETSSIPSRQALNDPVSASVPPDTPPIVWLIRECWVYTMPHAKGIILAMAVLLGTILAALSR